MLSIILSSLLAGVGISICAGPIGCFMLWQRMSYFADSLAHSILFGMILGIIMGISPLLGGIIIAVIIAFLISSMNNIHSNDSLLGIISQSCIALSIVANSYFKSFKIDIGYYLFGDILAINYSDIIEIYLLAICIYTWLALRWRKIMLIVISSELAYADNIPVDKIKLELTLIISIVIACSFKIIGILLITSMLIIPSAIAKILSNSPKQMIFYSVLIGIISNILGILISVKIDIATGASIIMISLLILIMASLKNYLRSFKKVI